MKPGFQIVLNKAAWLVFLLTVAGCASVSEHTHAYLGSPRFPATDAAKVQILASEPSQPKERLGEVMLHIDGNPARESVEEKLRAGGAKLGADAVFLVYDKMHIFPVVYGGWPGPNGMSEEIRRDVVAIAIKYK